jgi:hypothetical protein
MRNFKVKAKVKASRHALLNIYIILQGDWETSKAIEINSVERCKQLKYESALFIFDRIDFDVASYHFLLNFLSQIHMGVRKCIIHQIIWLVKGLPFSYWLFSQPDIQYLTLFPQSTHIEVLLL